MTLSSASPTSTTVPPADAGRTSAAAASHRRSASSPVRRDEPAVLTAASSRSAAAYPPGATGSAPGVATTTAGTSVTEASTPPAARAPETRIGTPGNARPSSSAVRSEPTRTDRSTPAPHSVHRQSVASRPHQPHVGTPSAVVSPSGPWHSPQRAAARHRPHATAGT